MTKITIYTMTDGKKKAVEVEATIHPTLPFAYHLPPLDKQKLEKGQHQFDFSTSTAGMYRSGLCITHIQTGAVICHSVHPDDVQDAIGLIGAIVTISDKGELASLVAGDSADYGSLEPCAARGMVETLGRVLITRHTAKQRGVGLPHLKESFCALFGLTI